MSCPAPRKNSRRNVRARPFAAHIESKELTMAAISLAQARRTFAESIRTMGGIKSPALVDALATVPREDFLGPGPWRILRAAEMAKGYQSTPDPDPRHICDNVLVALDESRKLNNGEPLGLMIFLDTLTP